VREQVARFFNKQSRTELNPEEAVAMGAALQAETLQRLLAKPRTGRIPVQAPPPPEEDSITESFTDPMALAPDSITLPPTAAPTAGTAYSLTRTGTRDALEPRSGEITRDGEKSFDTRTPPHAQPIGRLTRQQVPTPTSPMVPPPLPGAQNKTLFGVAPGPPPVPKGRPTPPPRPAVRPETEETTQQQAPMLDLAPVGMQPLPASTLPLSPVAPIAAATAPTLVALAPDFAAEVEQTGPGTAASTAKGMGPMITATGVVPPRPPPVAPVVLEVTPRGLGIGTVAGFCEELIRRNSRLPAEMKKLFTTSRDQQDTVRIIVCQGESRRLDTNTVIGDLLLEALPPRPRGETSIEVTFSVDASGILQVSARDALTGREQRASLDLVGGMHDVAASRDRLQQLRR
jgi:hypothetical protein